MMRSKHTDPRGPAAVAAERGFSLIEVLVAGFLLLVVLLALVPLFTRSIMANATGFEYTEVSNAARSRAEEFLQFGFNSEPLRINAGTERTYIDVYSSERDTWIDEADLPSTDLALFTRTTSIRQYSINDLENPLSAGATPAQIHLKEIEVEVEAVGAPGVLGEGKTIGLRVFKSQ